MTIAHYKVGDYIVERIKGTCNIKIAEIVSINYNNIYDSYDVKVVKNNEHYFRDNIISFDIEYIHALYKKVPYNDAELLARML